MEWEDLRGNDKHTHQKYLELFRVGERRANTTTSSDLPSMVRAFFLAHLPGWSLR